MLCALVNEGKRSNWVPSAARVVRARRRWGIEASPLSSCRLRGLSDDDGYELDSLFDARMDSCLQITFTRQACQSMHGARLVP